MIHQRQRQLATPTSTPTGELVAIGNLIFNDLNNDGNFDPGDGESGIDNVSVELFNTGDDPLTATPVATTTTAGGGFYEFDNLTPGSYFVFIPEEEFQAGGDLENFLSSTGNGNDETSDQDVDENGIDNADPATNGIQSTDFNLQPNSEVTGEDQTSYTGSLDDDNVNFTADLGFVEQINTPTPTNTPVPPTATPTSTPTGELVAIGNILFNDLNNDGNFDPGDGETGIDNVSVELFNSGDDPLTATPVATTTTAGGGFYEFDNLTPGSYFVFIPEEEFQAGGDLENFLSSTGNGNDETSDQDVDENGIDNADPATNGIQSTDFNLQPNSEVTGEDQTSYTGSLDDDNVNFTADFGMTAAGTPTATPTATPTPDGNTPTPTATPTSTPGGDTPTPAPTATPTSTPTGELVAIGNLIFNDLNNDGNFDPGDGETGIDNVSVELFNSGDDPLTATPVATTTTAGGGFYEFDNLTPGSYFVFIPEEEFQAGGDLENFLSSTGNGNDETSDQDVDENGIDNADPATNGIQSTDFNLQPNSEVTGEDQTSYTGSLDDDNVNFTADFGMTAAGTPTATPTATPTPDGNTPTPTATPTSTPGGDTPTPAPTATPTSTPTGELVAIGNLIFNDLNNDGNFDPGDGETGIDNVSVELFNSGDDPLTATPVATTTTAGGGFYEFDNLTPGSYFVFIPEEEFQAGGDLENFVSSTGNGNDETSDQDVDENGIDDADPATNGIQSTDFDLQPNSEVTGEDQTSYTGSLDDDNVNFTADFGMTAAGTPTATPTATPTPGGDTPTPTLTSTSVPPTETPLPTSTLVNPPTSTPTNTPQVPPTNTGGDPTTTNADGNTDQYTTGGDRQRQHRPIRHRYHQRLPIHRFRQRVHRPIHHRYRQRQHRPIRHRFRQRRTPTNTRTGTANGNADQYTTSTTDGYQYTGSANGNADQYATSTTDGYQYTGSANGNADQYATSTTDGYQYTGSANKYADQYTGSANGDTDQHTTGTADGYTDQYATGSANGDQHTWQQRHTNKHTW